PGLLDGHGYLIADRTRPLWWDHNGDGQSWPGPHGRRGMPGVVSRHDHGGTIAHGYLTLALAPRLLDEVLPLGGYAMAVNYGLDKLRFPAPLPVGDQV